MNIEADIRNLSKWLNEEQTAPIDRQALARLLAWAQMADKPAAWVYPEFFEGITKAGCWTAYAGDGSAAADGVKRIPLYRGALTGGDERRHIICLCPDCTKPAQQQEPPAGCVVVSRAVLKTLGIDDAVIDTIARPAPQPAQQQEPFGHVTVRRLSQRFENHADQYWFFPAGQSPYRDNVDEIHAVYTSPPASKPLTDEMVVAAARMLSDRQAAACNVDCGDMWKLHGNDFIEDARDALEAAHGIKGDA